LQIPQTIWIEGLPASVDLCALRQPLQIMADTMEVISS
jgi:hypothetical protein